MKTPTELHKESLDPKNNKTEIYNNWANTYDNYVDSLDYLGPQNIVMRLKNILKKSQHRTLQILDFGCGTGKIGEELEKQFSIPYYLEGIDISPNMLEIAQKKNIYNKLTCIDLTKEDYDSKYDIILSSGVFLEGHVEIHNVERLYKLLNKNGILLFTIRETFKNNNLEDFSKYVQNNTKFDSCFITNIQYLKDVKCNLVILTL